MSRPRIGVSGVVRTWDGGERTGVNAAYARAVLAAGGLPVILTPLVDPAWTARLLDGIDGLLLTGGEDVAPSWYGAPPSPHLEAVSPERDRFELALFAIARERGLPMLGICRGIQLINVALGGTLWQDLATERPGPVHHSPDRHRTERTHRVRVQAHSLAANALGRGELMVNSIHHQGIRDLAGRLTATAWADDGLIEAVEGPADEPWLLAVQWHPEELHADREAPDHGLFRALVDAAAIPAVPSPAWPGRTS